MATSAVLNQEALAQQVLQDTFGYQHFRPGQQTIINEALSGRDCLVGTKMLVAEGILQYLLRQRFLIKNCRGCHAIPVFRYGLEQVVKCYTHTQTW